jgi:hypothetical protein
MSGTGKRWLGRLLLACVSSVFALLALEVGLRLTWSSYYLKDAEPYAEPDPVRGWRLRAGVRLEDGEPEFKVTIHHNRWGFRGGPLERAKGERKRVLVLGDSFTYGVGVEDHETFSARLEQLEPSLEVINTGANGYGTGQELLLLRDEGLAFEPDIVVLAVFWNDIANNVERPDLRFGLRDGQLVYPARRDGLPPISLEPRRHRWLRHSYAYRFASDRLKSVRFWLKVQLGQPLQEGARLEEAERAHAWEVEYALIREVQALCSAHGVKLLLVLIPEQVQVEPEAKVLGLVEADYQVQGPLLEFAQREGIAALDLLPPLRAAHLDSGAALYYTQDRHFLPRAHELAAAEIQRQLRALGWIDAGHPEGPGAPLSARGDGAARRGARPRAGLKRAPPASDRRRAACGAGRCAG